ncbi:MAG: hypothetical protein V7K27_05585 [Nostoc sp.]|uniref:hypothetical protein n=1 Tax=Nostoc sp. TaxID=1180 RepID=UPI002FF6425E
MSNIDNITSNYSVVGQEQLFTELTLEEGAVIEGGLTYDLSNNSGVGINYNINGKSDFLNPGDQTQYSYSTAPTVSFDSQIGSGYVPVYQKLVSEPGENVFDVANVSTLVLISSTPGGSSSNPPVNVGVPQPVS